MSTGSGEINRRLLIVATLGVASLTALLFALRRRNRRPSTMTTTESKNLKQEKTVEEPKSRNSADGPSRSAAADQSVS